MTNTSTSQATRHRIAAHALRCVLALVQLAAAAGSVALGNSTPVRADVAPGGTTATQITGTVFQDYNSNGTHNTDGTSPNLAIDTGVSGVTVRTFLRGSTNPAATATTNVSGAYTLTGLTSGALYRVEFSTLPDGYYPSTHGASGSTSIASNSTSGERTTRILHLYQSHLGNLSGSLRASKWLYCDAP